MFFWLKKFIGFWLMPLSFCGLGLVIGLFLQRFTKRTLLGRRLVLVSTLTLLIFSNKWVALTLYRPLESRYPAIPEFTAERPLPPELAGCGYVAILGGGNGYSDNVSANNLLWAPAVARLAEGVRILRVLPEAKLIVSGGSPGPRETHARVMGRAVQAYGIEPARILYVEDARDTEDESRRVAAIAQGRAVAVVTSGWHMPRAMALFRSAGATAVACPTEFLTHGNGPIAYTDFLWDIQSLGLSTLAIRERVGQLWITLRGKT